jgi:hypothetical protein
MDGWKKRMAFLWRKIKRIKQWHLAVIFLILLVVVIFALRSNNLGMVELRDKVVEADKALDWDEVNSSAEVLHAYVNKHMNTNTGQIALQNLYDRDVEEAFVAANSEVDSDIYTLASEDCQVLLAQSGYQVYASCVADAVGVSNEEITIPNLPNSALYYISFLSPKFSFDLAGICIFMMIVVFLTFLLRLITEVILGVVTRKRLKYDFPY